jgi:hypothetical protein
MIVALLFVTDIQWNRTRCAVHAKRDERNDAAAHTDRGRGGAGPVCPIGCRFFVCSFLRTEVRVQEFMITNLVIWSEINVWNTVYEGESNENRKKIFKFNLLNESGTQLYHFST